MDTAIADQVREVLGQVAPETAGASLKPDVPFRQQIEFDSVDFLKFVLKLQDRFGLSIPEDHYPLLATLDGCAAYLGAHLNRSAY